MSDERRKSPRYEVDLPVRLDFAGASFGGRARDLCRDAVLVEADVALSLDTAVSVTFQLHRSEGPLQVAGRVVRAVAAADGHLPAMAVLFTELTPSAVTSIDMFIAGQSDPAGE
jgi:PilZ domain